MATINRPGPHSRIRPVGGTDSERAFCWLMQELAKSHAGLPGGIDEITLTLRELLPRIPCHGACNSMLSSGRAPWAHASTLKASGGAPCAISAHAARMGACK